MRYIKLLSIAVSLSWLFVILIWSGFTVKTILSNSAKSEWKLDASLKSTIERKISDNIRFKSPLVELNGGWSRLLGRIHCNEVFRLKNGHISRLTPYHPQDEYVQRTDALARYCKSKNIEFLFVLFGRKIDQEGLVLPRGCPKDYSWRNSDEFLSSLKDAEFLDLRSYTSKTVDDVTDNYFKTDHHWNFKGCIKVFPIIVERIFSKLDCGHTNKIGALNLSNWDVVQMPRRFTGSFSQRTGRIFGGTDELNYFIPSFQTEMMSSYMNKNGICNYMTGSFKDALLNKHMLAEPASFLGDAAYSVYGWGGRSLYIHKNRLAPIKKRVLVVKDSFAVPITSFLSTVFSEIVAVDLRYYKGVDVEKYISILSPDIVSVMYNIGSLAPGDMFNFGTYSKGLDTKILIEESSLSIIKSTIGSNCVKVPVVLESGALIKVTVDSVEECSAAQALQCSEICLINKKSGKLVSNAYLYSDFSIQQVVTLKVPNDSKDGEYDLVFYAGSRESCIGNELVLKGLMVEIVK